MERFFESLLKLWSEPLTGALLVVLAVLAGFFIWQVLFRGIVLAHNLKKMARNARSISSLSVMEAQKKLEESFSQTRWKDLWTEFSDTLHQQSDPNEIEPSILSVRATVSADAVFTPEALVDGPLHAEFYRHLPGILTGLGIIGTFYGLIRGLGEFKPDMNAVDGVNAQLSQLFGHVLLAFVFSTIAIALAMFFTIVEKIVYARCVAHANALTLAIDGLFKTGVGEEYLSTLVIKADETSTQTRQLKDSLVDDLKVMLSNLTEQQIAATRQLSIDIGEHLDKQVAAPMKEVISTFNSTQSSTASVAANVLENLMTAFMAQMKESVGGQMNDLSDLMKGTASSMATAEQSMRQLVADMNTASGAASVGMQEAMREVLAHLGEHQKTSEATAAETQLRLSSELQVAMSRLAEVQGESTRLSNEAATEAAKIIRDATGAAVRSGDEAVQAAHGLVERIGGVSTSAIEGLERGAHSIQAASAGVEDMIVRLNGACQGLASLHEEATKSNEVLGRSTANLEQGARGVSAAASALSHTVDSLTKVAGLMSTEAEARSQILSDLQRTLSGATQSLEQFSGLSRTLQDDLANSVARFGKATTEVLSANLVQFDDQLANAAKILSGIMDELAEQGDRLNKSS